MSSLTLEQVRDRLRSYAKDTDLYAIEPGKSLELTTADELADAIEAHLAAVREVIAELRQASSDTDCALHQFCGAKADELEAAIKGGA